MLDSSQIEELDGLTKLLDDYKEVNYVSLPFI